MHFVCCNGAAAFNSKGQESLSSSTKQSSVFLAIDWSSINKTENPSKDALEKIENCANCRSYKMTRVTRLTGVTMQTIQIIPTE